MKYSLRSLMIAVLVLPPLLAGGWVAVRTAIAPVEKADDDISPSGGLGKAIEKYEAYLKNNEPAKTPSL